MFRVYVNLPEGSIWVSHSFKAKSLVNVPLFFDALVSSVAILGSPAGKQVIFSPVHIIYHQNGK